MRSEARAHVPGGDGAAVVAVAVASTAVIGGIVVAIVMLIVLVSLVYSSNYDVLGAPSYRCGTTLPSTSSNCKGSSLNASLVTPAASEFQSVARLSD